MLPLLAAAVTTRGAPELRGVWADAFHNGMKSASQVTQLVSNARAGNFNAVFVQIRKRGDAYYSNGLEPRATDITGGASFDPLADLINKAHSGSPRIDVHAWVVTYNIWNNKTTPPSQATHPYRLHPDWLTQKQDGTTWDGANYAFDPGHPEVQEHTFNVCMDLLDRYNIDGLHFDYIRYTDSESSIGNQPYGYNPVAVQRFQQLTGRAGVPASNDSHWLQFRRDQVSALLRRVYLNAWKRKPNVRISAALISYGNAPADSSTAAWRGRDAYGRNLQDWRSWMQEGILDLAVPMVYRHYDQLPASFNNWSNYTKDNQFNRDAAPGVGFYLNTPSQNIAQIQQVRTASPNGNSVNGVLGYSYQVPADDNTDIATFYAQLTGPGGVFASPATVPEMPWKTNAATGHIMGTVASADGTVTFDGATVTLSGPQARTLKSDATGFFGALELPPGSYSAQMQVPGYQPATVTFHVTGAQVAEVDFALTPLPFTITASAWNPAQRILSLTWNSRPEKSYRIEASTNLISWMPLATGVASGGYATSYTSPAQPSGIFRRFFRVKEE